MYCKNCGHQIEGGKKFCKNCGTGTHHSHATATAPVATVLSAEGVSKWIRLNKSLLIGGAVIVLIIAAYMFFSNGGSSSQDVQQSVVDVNCDNGKGGSGTIFTSNGTILTNNHVITGATSCEVTIPDPTTGQIDKIYEAVPVIVPKLSKKYDIATLKIDGAYTDSNGKTWGPYPTTFTPFVLPSSCNPSSPSQLGDSVKIYGYPITSGGYNLTITDGIISSFSNNGYILTSAKVDSGNSGGLAVDQNGCWLGIPSAVESGNYQNLGVIIPGSVVAANFLSTVPAKPNPAGLKSPTSAAAADTAATPQLSKDQSCQSNYGTYSEWSGQLDSSGNPTCQCQAGYSWDESGNACASQVALDSSCVNSYGTGSYSYTQSGKAVCGCSTGYTWNSDQSACVVAPPVETGYQVCTAMNATWDGSSYTSSGGYNCTCDTGYISSAGGSTCVYAQPSCAAFSSYNSNTGTCQCDAGYTTDGYGGCESELTYCQNLDGYGATYDAGSNSCACSYGYTYSGGQCVSGLTYCQNLDGYGATYDSGTNSCSCESGYIYSGGQCVDGYTYCTNTYGAGSQYDYATGGCQ